MLLCLIKKLPFLVKEDQSFNLSESLTDGTAQFVLLKSFYIAQLVAV